MPSAGDVGEPSTSMPGNQYPERPVRHMTLGKLLADAAMLDTVAQLAPGECKVNAPQPLLLLEVISCHAHSCQQGCTCSRATCFLCMTRLLTVCIKLTLCMYRFAEQQMAMVTGIHSNPWAVRGPACSHALNTTIVRVTHRASLCQKLSARACNADCRCPIAYSLWVHSGR